MRKFIIAVIGAVVMTLLTGLVLTSCDSYCHNDGKNSVEYAPEDSAFMCNMMNEQSSHVYKSEDVFVEHAKSMAEHDDFVSLVSTMQYGTIRAVLATLKNRDIPLTEKAFVKEYLSQQSIYDAVDRSLRYPDKELDTALDTQSPTKQEKGDSLCEQ